VVVCDRRRALSRRRQDGWGEKFVQRSLETSAKSSSSLQNRMLEVRRFEMAATSVEIKGFFHLLSVLRSTLFVDSFREKAEKSALHLAACFPRERSSTDEGNFLVKCDFSAVEDAA